MVAAMKKEVSPGVRTLGMRFAIRSSMRVRTPPLTTA
jgi:hypothetical protein